MANMVPTQKIDLCLCPMVGNIASSVNGVPTWVSSDIAIASVLTTSNGGLAARILANAVGSCTITCTAVGNSGNIVKVVDIVVGTQYATSANVTVSEPF